MQTINLGAYGWRHKHWLKSFYPEDLPVEGAEDWRLAYYSNEFNAVLVPAGYWQAGQRNDCEDWLDSVHPGFRFFVECHGSMLDTVSLADLTVVLKILAPQLSGLVLLNDCQQVADDAKKPFLELADLLQCELFASGSGLAQQGICWPDEYRASPAENSQNSSFAFVEDDLSDLRKVRAMVEQYAMHLKDEEASMIVDHPQLQATDLGRFQAMLEIMGY